MHDGSCNGNCGITARQSVVLLSGVAALSIVAVTALKPHDDNTALIATIVGVFAPLLGQLIGVNKTQEVHQSLCDTAKTSNDKKEEIRQLVEKDIETTTAVKALLEQPKQ